MTIFASGEYQRFICQLIGKHWNDRTIEKAKSFIMRYTWDISDINNNPLVQSVENMILIGGQTPVDFVEAIIAVMTWAGDAFPSSWNHAFGQLPKANELRFRVFFSGFSQPERYIIWRRFLKGPVPRLAKRRTKAETKFLMKVRGLPR
jgi:hypothetical protein